MSSCSDAARERRLIQAQPRNALPCALQYVMPTVSCADLIRLWCASRGAVTISVIAKVGCCCEERVRGWCWGITSTTLARLEPRVGDSIAFVVIYYAVFSTLLHRTHRAQFPPGVSTCCIAFLQLSSYNVSGFVLGRSERSDNKCRLSPSGLITARCEE